MLRYVSPGYVLGTLLVSVVWKRLSKRLDSWGSGPPFWLRYYVLLYIALFVLLCGTVYSLRKDVLLITDVLDPKAVEAFVKDRMQLEEEGDLLQAWRDEASLEGYDWLVWFSLLSPIWTLATFCVCLTHTILHACRMEEARAKTPGLDKSAVSKVYFHSKVIDILILPTIYGLMALEGAIRMWGVVINHVTAFNHFTGWEHRKEFQESTFDNSTLVGDVYEAYALYVFGLIVMKLLGNHLDATVSSSRVDLMPLMPSAGRLRHNFTLSDVGAYASMEVEISELKAGIAGLTTLGIKWFCMTCIFQSVFVVLVTSMDYYYTDKDLFAQHGFTHALLTPDLKKASNHFFYGAGFVASFAAIGSLVEVERAFHKILSTFFPVLKFLGTKILVTLAFAQQMALAACPPFCWWSTTRSNLFYASLICFECFLISLLHCFAWSPNEAWYDTNLVRQNSSARQDSGYEGVAVTSNESETVAPQDRSL